MQNLLRKIKFYFTYHRKDKYGIIVLLILCGGLLISPEIYYHFVAKQKIIDHINITNENFVKLVKQFEIVNDTNDFVEESNYGIETKPINKEIKPVDINLATALDLKQLKGIGEVFSKRIIKYRNSKNGFDNLTDLKSVYGITDSLYDALLPRLSFTPIKKQSKKNSLAKNSYKSNFDSKPPSYKNNKKTTKNIKPAVTIDINTATAIDLKQLKGIGKVLSERIVKFREAIGGFEKIEQLNDVYGIEDSLYFTLLDNVEMSKIDKPVKVSNENFEGKTTSRELINEVSYNKKTTKSKVEKPVSKPKPPIVVDINKASVSEFQQLNGIGNFRAKEIIAHREKLGGFYKIEQLKEVYSFTDSLYSALKPQLSISTTAIKKININIVDFKVLLKHPYFDFNLTKHLTNFRDQREGLKNLEELKESYLIDDELYKKLAIYLTAE